VAAEDTVADETDAAAEDTVAAEAATAADATVEAAAIDAEAAVAAAVTDHDTKPSNVLSLEIFSFFDFLSL
jgi:hypothetical protein